jgi:hypothetical protein
VRGVYYIAVLALLSGCNESKSPDPAPINVDALIALNDETFDLVLQSADSASSAAMEAAERDFLTAFEAARPQIIATTQQINHRPRSAEGGIQAAEISACIDMNAGNMLSVDNVIQKAHEKGMLELLGAWLSSSSDCTFRSDAYLSHVPPAEDLGYVVSITYPLTLAIHARASSAGMQIPSEYYVSLIESYQRANDQIIRTAAASRPTSHAVAMNIQPKLEAVRQKLLVFVARDNTPISASQEAQPAR